MRKKQKRSKNSIFPLPIDQLLETIQSKFEGNDDLKISKHEHNGKKLVLFYIEYQADSDMLQNYLLRPILHIKKDWTNDELINHIPLTSPNKETELEKILEGLIVGHVFIYVEGESEAVSYSIVKKETRSLEKAETESLVLGPKISFTESLKTNLNIIRWRIKSTDLVVEELKVGKTVPAGVRLVYMKSIANEVDVNTMRQRIEDLDIDEVEDSIVLKQYLEDSQNNLFPQFDSTELPDRFTYGLTKGKIGVLMENSPTGIVAPATLFSYLESTEDLYMRWQAGSFLRILRFMSMFFSVLVTPAYVAVVTYQYGIIPTQLLISLGQSRAAVPFPPLIEALILEFLIELLREAGARLPTKVGQTMGIVGGIVIGQAAVEAGLTSNILIIVIAMSALASFTTPSYLLGTTIRLIRFPMIVLAGIFGLYGIIFGICFLIIHLLNLKSLGRPYLVPLYPLQLKDFNKVFFRTPFNHLNKRARSYRPKDLIRFSKQEAEKRKDIDE
ncbi:spore germination protein [Ornithinibacillus halophilus]|uniref:GerA spore germination protein n=1 Tax=Ornithinibacillus halophilus TaxID=930117 RepID=A0A1M5HXA6_9BACI|nr:spore germination protein [Ornithinibacillus halophilus]SHG20595.1 GerA spore germination protein [Ornithinibacillus halophilus]